MDFTLSAEQEALRTSGERLVRERWGFDVAGAASARSLNVPSAAWATFAELGWLGLGIPESAGGFGESSVETMVILEALGSGLVLEPFVASVVSAGSVLGRASANAFAAGALEAMIDGSTIGTLAYAESAASWGDVAAPANVGGTVARTTATRTPGGFVLRGHKVAVPYAVLAGWLVVSAILGDSNETGLLLVPADLPGIRRRDYATFDERLASDITFTDVALSSQSLVSADGAGLATLERAIDRSIAASCAEAVGVMQSLHARTVDFLKERKQFGRPIGSFQALQHRAVDMLVACELARSMMLAVTSAIDAHDVVERRKVTAAAQVFVCGAARVVAEGAIQLHGAMGLTNEFSVGRYAKRALLIGAEFGGEDLHLARYMALTNGGDMTTENPLREAITLT